MDAREIDRLIAEHLMGMECWQAHNGVWRVVISERTKGGRHWPRPRALSYYSTTWDGMREVVEAMRERGWWLHLYQCEAGWRAEFVMELSKGIALRFAVADTAPKAVALAALKALGVEVPS